jgi:adenosyl cobinamide kinase/adenosyl cobinamide phosphate guanylyltransferase
MITLVLGGARSGKSEIAERLASGCGSEVVTYIATAATDLATGEDPELSARIAAHRARRPPLWRTIELGRGADLGKVIEGCDGPVLVDSIGTWVAGHDGFAVDSVSLLTAISGHRFPTVVVSDEVGLGVHPFTESGRVFRDVVGDINRELASLADEVLLVVAGRVVSTVPFVAVRRE